MGLPLSHSFPSAPLPGLCPLTPRPGLDQGETVIQQGPVFTACGHPKGPRQRVQGREGGGQEGGGQGPTLPACVLRW